MKQLIAGLSSLIIGILAVMIVMTISGRMTRTKELNASLSSAVDNAVENVLQNKTYTINNKNEFTADLIESLLATYDSDSSFDINISSVDIDKGIFSLTIVEHYKNINGKDGQYQCDKTVVFDADTNNKEVTIKYLGIDNTVFQEFSVRAGEKIKYPAVVPTVSGKILKGWQSGSNTYTADEIKNIIATTDYIFKPVFQ